MQAEVVPRLLLEFPESRERWDEHVRYWEGKPAGYYNDMAQFVHFVIEDLYEKGKIERTRHAFDLLENMFAEGGQDVRDLIGFGFFETLRNVASWRPFGDTVFEPFLGPMSRLVWDELSEIWAGKSSLMDVIRAERKAGEK